MPTDIVFALAVLYARPLERARRVEGVAADAGDRRRPGASSSSPSSTRATSTAWPWRSRSGSSSRSRSCGSCSGRRRLRGARAASWVALDAGGVADARRVVIAFLTPAVAFQRPRHVSAEAHRVADLTLDEPDPPDADAQVARPRAHARGDLASGPSRGAPVAWSSHGGPALRAGQRRCPAVRSRGRGGREQPSRARHPHLQDRAPLDRAAVLLVALRLGLAPCPKVRRGHVVAGRSPASRSLSRCSWPSRPAGEVRRRRWRSCLRRPRPGLCSPCSDGARAGARACSVAGQLTDDSLYLPGPAAPPVRSRPETRGGRNVLHGVLAQGGPIDAVFGSFETNALWVILVISLVALVFAYYLVREALAAPRDRRRCARSPPRDPGRCEGAPPPPVPHRGRFMAIITVLLFFALPVPEDVAPQRVRAPVRPLARLPPRRRVQRHHRAYGACGWPSARTHRERRQGVRPALRLDVPRRRSRDVHVGSGCLGPP